MQWLRGFSGTPATAHTRPGIMCNLANTRASWAHSTKLIVFSSFQLKEKSSHDVDDDVLLEREITPARNFQVSTKAVGVILVSTV
ncbi:MAG TPA: hypothetical protein VIO15_06180 [Bacteroidales bacterium]